MSLFEKQELESEQMSGYRFCVGYHLCGALASGSTDLNMVNTVPTGLVLSLSFAKNR